ncbi:MAG: hypothetical protein IJW46_01485 [Clostridia bacterium]|nr:hypothetical protein [Clostridia bacterium]
MPLWLILTLCAYLVLITPTAMLVTRLLSKKRSALIGLLVPLCLTALSYAASLVIFLKLSPSAGLIAFGLFYLAALASFLVFSVLRIKRYRTLREAYEKQKRARRPAAYASLKLKRQLKGFSCPSPLSVADQHEVVILLENRNDPKALAPFYNCRESDLVAIGEAFRRYSAERVPVGRGEAYTVLPEQREFLIRLMTTATPASLLGGNGLLWNDQSVATLIHKASGHFPSENSVLTFLSESGILLCEEDYAFTETPEAKLWERTQFEKIRMSALERSATIFWVYTRHIQGLPYTVLCATNPEYPTAFGIYKENSGLSDFLSKLTQLSSQPLYVILCFKTAQFKKFTSPPQNVTLFPYGERTDIPDT